MELQLGEVSLISPADDSEDVAVVPTFRWSAVDGAAGYQIQVSESRNMRNRVIDFRGVAGTSFTPADPLDEDDTHYWRVRALEDDDDDEGPWSERWSFETGELPNRPSLSSPSHQEDEAPLSPQLVWQNTSGADSYEVEVSTDSDFSPLIFEQSGIAGTSLTLPMSLQSDTRYYWRVRASNEIGDGPFSNSRWFRTIESSPSQVSLASPADGATGVSTTPTFSWQSTAGAGSYTLEVSGSSGFASFVIQVSGLTSSSFTPANPLVNGALLYWRVRATNSVGDGPNSSVRQFTTLIGGPTQVTLISPANGSDDVGASPTLVWQAVEGANNYRVQVSKVSNFSSNVIHDTIVGGTQFQVGPLEFGQTYFWRVRASNAGSENWSTAASFKTGSGAPAQVALQSPQNDADDQPLSVTLAWSATAGAETYNLQVALDQNFTTILLSETGLTATNYVLEGLDHSTDYYWRVQAANGVGTGGWSAARTFTTQVVLGPAAPALIYPPDGADNVHANPVFSWNETDGAESYKLELSTSPPDELENFVTVVIAVVVQQAFFQSPTLSVGQDYYWRVESRNAAGSARSPVRSFRTSVTTSSETDEIPAEFSLEQNYPNPFNPSTTIRYNLPEAADVQLIVLDALGRVVDDLDSRHMAPGAHSVVWNAETRPSGIYFVRMEAKGYVGLRRMVLVK